MSPAGYSGTPLAKKLAIKAGHRLLLVDAPPDFERTLGALPEDVVHVGARAAALDVVVLFVTKASVLRRRFAGIAKRLQPTGALWVGWPKKTSGVTTDLSFDVVQYVGLDAGLVDTKICAIDETWSGLMFRVRTADR